MAVPVDPFNFANGAVADGDQVDARFAPLYAALDHALAADNLSSGLLNTFLKLAVAADIKLAFGSTSINGDGSSFKQVVVNHGLGRTPIVVIPVMKSNTGVGGYKLFASVDTLTSTQFTVGVYHADGSGWSSVHSFYWLAIG